MTLGKDMRFVALAVLLSTLALVAARAETSLRSLWSSSAYVEVKPFPSAWLSDQTPLTELSFAAFQRLEAKDLSIRILISRFGKPMRYLVPTKKKNEFGFIIYDLPSGHSVAAYVSEPPRDGIGAIVMIDPKGKLLRLIK